jgi:FlaA1/EpsC-like NDP-sugar epimerase
MRSWESVWSTLDAWQRVSMISLLVASIAQTVFVVLYVERNKWKNHYVGRALMAQSVTLLVALWSTLLNAFFVYPYQEQIGSFIFLLLTVAIIYQCSALIRAIREGNNEDSSHDRTRQSHSEF